MYRIDLELQIETDLGAPKGALSFRLGWIRFQCIGVNGKMEKTLDTMTKQELLDRRHQNEIRLWELDPEPGQNPPKHDLGEAQRHSRYLDEYQNLKAENIDINTRLKNI